MLPLISIVVPVYRVEKYIENCMRSISRQSFTNFEVILVNDGTDDDSIEIAEKILTSNNINYVIINQANQGQSIARNVGMTNASGEWIVFVDSDDTINVDFLKILYEASVKNGVNVSFGNFQTVNPDDIFKQPVKKYEAEIISKIEMLDKFLAREIKIIVPAILLKRELVFENNLFFNEEMKFSEDQEFIWRLLFSTEKFSYNRTPIYNYLSRSNSIMTSSNIDKLITGYNGFLAYTNSLQNSYHSKYADMIMSKWVYALLHSSAKILGFGDYQILLRKINYRRYLVSISRFPDYRVKILSIILRKSIYAFYLINRTL